MWRRKRRRLPLESYEQSATVTKLTDLIGRGQVSIAAAADIARCVVKDHTVPDPAVPRS